MSEDRRSTLEVLRYELNFLEQGGYRRSCSVTRGNVSPFQNTLSCLNFGEPSVPMPVVNAVCTTLSPKNSVLKTSLAITFRWTPWVTR